MQALGVGEAPLRAEYDLEGKPRPATSPPEGDVADRVVGRAHELAAHEGADSTGTAHLLGALFEVYGSVMERALELHGATRARAAAARSTRSPSTPRRARPGSSRRRAGATSSSSRRLKFRK